MAKRQLVREYFKAFSEKDLVKLREMFADTVQVNDWEIDIEGVDNVLAHNERVFNSIKTIDIKINSMGNISDDYIMADITILIDDTVTLNVEDRITFNQDNKITRVKAYKK